MKSTRFAFRMTILVASFVLGCGEKPAPSTAEKPKSKSGRTEPAADQEETSTKTAAAKPAKRKFQPVQLGGEAGGGGGAGESSVAKPRLSGEKRSRAVIAALQPLQVLLGEWRWITNKEFG